MKRVVTQIYLSSEYTCKVISVQLCDMRSWYLCYVYQAREIFIFCQHRDWKMLLYLSSVHIMMDCRNQKHYEELELVSYFLFLLLRLQICLWCLLYFSPDMQVFHWIINIFQKVRAVTYLLTLCNVCSEEDFFFFSLYERRHRSLKWPTAQNWKRWWHKYKSTVQSSLQSYKNHTIFLKKGASYFKLIRVKG